MRRIRGSLEAAIDGNFGLRRWPSSWDAGLIRLFAPVDAIADMALAAFACSTARWAGFSRVNIEVNVRRCRELGVVRKYPAGTANGGGSQDHHPPPRSGGSTHHPQAAVNWFRCRRPSTARLRFRVQLPLRADQTAPPWIAGAAAKEQTCALCALWLLRLGIIVCDGRRALDISRRGWTSNMTGSDDSFQIPGFPVLCANTKRLLTLPLTRQARTQSLGGGTNWATPFRHEDNFADWLGRRDQSLSPGGQTLMTTVAPFRCRSLPLPPPTWFPDSTPASPMGWIWDPSGRINATVRAGHRPYCSRRQQFGYERRRPNRRKCRHLPQDYEDGQCRRRTFEHGQSDFKLSDKQLYEPSERTGSGHSLRAIKFRR